MTGGTVKITADGGAVVLNGDKVVALVPKPWAKDANGRNVPTRFTTNGTTLTQHVSHKGRNVAYPVTADPRWVEYHWWGTVVHFTRGETRQAADFWQVLSFAFGFSWPVAAAMGAASWWIGQVANRGNCLVAVRQYPAMWEERC